MIHTIQFSTSQNIFPVTYEDYRTIKNDFETVRNKNGELIYIGNYKDLSFTYLQTYNLLYTKVNLNKLINKDIITDTDYKQVIDAIHDQFYEIFHYCNIGNLNRIDYKEDIHTPHKNTIIKLLKKGSNNYGALKQNKQYDTSIYYNSKSTHINIYDKHQELMSKDNNYLVDVDKYKDMIRFEVQLLNPKLYYIEKHEGICRELINYFSETDRDYYINKELRRIIYNGDYYNTYNSNKILLEHYSKSMTDKLITVQKDISINGITKAKSNYNSTTFNSYIKKFEKAGVNPIPIPKNEGVCKIENPFKFTDENIYLLDNYSLKVAI